MYRILVAIDGSEHSRRAVDYAARRAKVVPCKIDLVHAFSFAGMAAESLSLRTDRRRLCRRDHHPPGVGENQQVQITDWKSKSGSATPSCARTRRFLAAPSVHRSRRRRCWRPRRAAAPAHGRPIWDMPDASASGFDLHASRHRSTSSINASFGNPPPPTVRGRRRAGACRRPLGALADARETHHGVAATPDHPSLPSARASQIVKRYSRLRVEALDLLSLRPVPLSGPVRQERVRGAARDRSPPRR